jgi:hypothetical protein
MALSSAAFLLGNDVPRLPRRRSARAGAPANGGIEGRPDSSRRAAEQVGLA